MRQNLCLESIIVQMFFDSDKNLKRDFIIDSKSNPSIFSYLSYILKTTIGFSVNNICIPQISFAYA